jgi:hypothetical protein
MHTEGHDLGKPEGVPAHPAPKMDGEHPGYETQDVNVVGVATFLAGLAGFVLVFFIFCFVMGKVINSALLHQDGPTNKFAAQMSQPGATPHGEKREDLASDAEMEQRQIGAMTKEFPTPQLQNDDGNQDTADLHAREDLLLDYNSTSADLPAGTVRIPIDRAMELIVQRGLPKAPATATPTTLMAGETTPVVQAPLTDGFARTGYELDTIAARQEKLEFEKAEKK